MRWNASLGITVTIMAWHFHDFITVYEHTCIFCEVFFIGKAKKEKSHGSGDKGLPKVVR